MKKRRKKKTQKELGYVSLGAWVRPELYEALMQRAESNHRSLTAEITAAIEAHTAKGQTT